MKNVPTPHITAGIEDFAKTVLMPGDPLRAKYIAETYLEDAVLINNVRGIQGYTGTYKGKKVSVMASGMGMPSMGIYSHELFNFYEVENIIRIGSAGAVSQDLSLKDIVFGMATCTTSTFASQYELPGTYAPICSYELLKKAEAAAEKIGVKPAIGNIYSTDAFYDPSRALEQWQKMGILAVEMEAAALYTEAAATGKNALCICTISDNPFTGEGCTVEERQTAFTQMMEIALEIA